MVAISYGAMVTFITALWLLVRGYFAVRTKTIRWKREVQLILVYICLIVVVRFTFCPFGKVDGQIQPLLFDPGRIFPPRINLVPLIYLLDYLIVGEAVLNVVGNTAMFIPIGIIWPMVFKELDSHGKVIAAGVGFSLCIEVLQLPFFDRVTDIDDLILNSVGFLIGYGMYLLVKKCKKKASA